MKTQDQAGDRIKRLTAGKDLKTTRGFCHKSPTTTERPYAYTPYRPASTKWFATAEQAVAAMLADDPKPNPTTP